MKEGHAARCGLSDNRTARQLDPDSIARGHAPERRLARFGDAAFDGLEPSEDEIPKGRLQDHQMVVHAKF